MKFLRKKLSCKQEMKRNSSSFRSRNFISKLTYQKRVVKPCFEGKLYTHLGKLLIFNIQAHERLKSTLQNVILLQVPQKKKREQVCTSFYLYIFLFPTYLPT